MLAIDLRVKLYFNYDVLKNIGNIKLKLFGITIFKSQVSLIGEYFNFIKGNKKVIQIKININNKNIEIIKDTFSYYLKKIFFICFYNSFTISSTNPFLCTMVAGSLKSAGGVLDSIVNSKYPNTKFNSNVNVGFIENAFKVELYTHLLINLFDLIWSFIKTIYRRSMLVYEKK